MGNIYLRSITQRDLMNIFALYSDEETCLLSGVPAAGSIDTAQKYLEVMLKNRDSFAIIKQTGGEFAGIISIRRDIHRFNPDAYMIGYRLKKRYWGQGLMPLAVDRILKYGFEALGARVITACHFEGNIRSKRVLEKCGFLYEGTLRKEYLRFDGQVMDSRAYSILYEEYMERKKRGKYGK